MRCGSYLKKTKGLIFGVHLAIVQVSGEARWPADKGTPVRSGAGTDAESPGYVESGRMTVESDAGRARRTDGTLWACSWSLVSPHVASRANVNLGVVGLNHKRSACVSAVVATGQAEGLKQGIAETRSAGALRC